MRSLDQRTDRPNSHQSVKWFPNPRVFIIFTFATSDIVAAFPVCAFSFHLCIFLFFPFVFFFPHLGSFQIVFKFHSTHLGFVPIVEFQIGRRTKVKVKTRLPPVNFEYCFNFQIFKICAWICFFHCNHANCSLPFQNVGQCRTRNLEKKQICVVHWGISGIFIHAGRHLKTKQKRKC